MKLKSENVSRKVDSLGRISIPKSLRDRLEISIDTPLDFFLLENDDGREYICIGSPKKVINPKYAAAVEVLKDLGLEIPEELKLKVEDKED